MQLANCSTEMLSDSLRVTHQVKRWNCASESGFQREPKLADANNYIYISIYM